MHSRKRNLRRFNCLEFPKREARNQMCSNIDQPFGRLVCILLGFIEQCVGHLRGTWIAMDHITCRFTKRNLAHVSQQGNCIICSKKTRFLFISLVRWSRCLQSLKFYSIFMRFIGLLPSFRIQRSDDSWGLGNALLPVTHQVAFHPSQIIDIWIDHGFTRLNEQLDRLAIRSDQTRLLILEPRFRRMMNRICSI